MLLERGRTTQPARTRTTPALKLDFAEWACYEISASHSFYIIVPNQHYDQMEQEDTFRRRYPLAYRYFSRNRRLLEQGKDY